MAFGAGKILDSGAILAPEVREGDRILFGKFSGTEVKVADQDYLILREDEIIGILTETGQPAGRK